QAEHQKDDRADHHDDDDDDDDVRVEQDRPTTSTTSPPPPPPPPSAASSSTSSSTTTYRQPTRTAGHPPHGDEPSVLRAASALFATRAPDDGDAAATPATPSSSSSPSCYGSSQPADTAQDDDNFFGLGSRVRRAVYKVCRIHSLHPWQTAALRTHISAAHNGLVLAPTSAGKTLVGLVLMLRALLLHDRDAVLTLPYVALVHEKVEQFRRLAAEVTVQAGTTFEVQEYAGSRGQLPLPPKTTSLRTVFVCTVEKAAVVWRQVLAARTRHPHGDVPNIALFVMDEVHMLADPQRGQTLEELIVSVLFWAGSATTILALSATVGNPHDVATFLGAGQAERCTVHRVHHRPTAALTEYAVVDGAAFPVQRTSDGGPGRVHFEGPPPPPPPPAAADAAPHAVHLLSTTDLLQDISILGEDPARLWIMTHQRLLAPHSALVHVRLPHRDASLAVRYPKPDHVPEYITKASAEVRARAAAAAAAATHTAYFTTPASILTERRNIIAHLDQESRRMVSPVLVDGIAEGVAFHSAALHPVERRAVEEAYLRKVVRVICCTTTLAAGVNLPAHRVIIRSPRLGGEFTTCSRYLQMIGRAGRDPDTAQVADAYIIIQHKDVGHFSAMVENHLEPIRSQMNQAESFFRRHARGATTTVPTPPPTTTTSHPYTGITRLVLSALAAAAPQKLAFHDLLRAYRLTLLYQQHTQAADDPPTPAALEPLCTELKALVTRGHVAVWIRDAQHIGGLREATERESILFCDTIISPHDTTDLSEIHLTLTPFTTATLAASIDLDDAQRFVKEATDLQGRVSLHNPLALLFLSLHEDLVRPLSGGDDVTLVNTEIGRSFQQHPDLDTFHALGLTQADLDRWITAAHRSDVHLTSRIARLWSALFATQICLHPDSYESLCLRFGFDRGAAMELTSNLAGRCANLRTFCLTHNAFWWYPPLAQAVIGRLNDACEDELRQLLNIKHVTKQRARDLYNMGCRTIADVAAMRPDDISDRIRYLGRWRAVEMYLDARRRVALEAMGHAAKCQHRYDALQRGEPLASTDVLSQQ
ncbi:Helicase and polymerase-containing protein TEBICHI, partial [Frankliniella fusca]